MWSLGEFKRRFRIGLTVGIVDDEAIFYVKYLWRNTRVKLHEFQSLLLRLWRWREREIWFTVINFLPSPVSLGSEPLESGVERSLVRILETVRRPRMRRKIDYSLHERFLSLNKSAAEERKRFLRTCRLRWSLNSNNSIFFRRKERKRKELAHTSGSCFYHHIFVSLSFVLVFQAWSTMQEKKRRHSHD